MVPGFMLTIRGFVLYREVLFRIIDGMIHQIPDS